VKKIFYVLKIVTKILIIYCCLSSSLLAIEPEEEISSSTARPPPSISRTRDGLAQAQVPLPPPSRWSRLCSKAKGIGKSAFNLLAFQNTYQTLRESTAVKRVVRGVVHLGVGVGGILLSRRPTEEELASATFLDHTYRNARDMYYVRHCFLGAQLILEPLVGSALQRTLPRVVYKMRPVCEQLPLVYQGTMNVIAGSGVIGYCRDINSIFFSLPGYGLGAVFILRGGQRLLITIKGYDPLKSLHRYFKESTHEHFLFTSQNSYLRRVMDGTAEVFAALTLHHALWPFIYDETTDLVSPLRKEQETRWLAKCEDIIKSGELPPDVTQRLDGQHQMYCRALLPAAFKNIASKQLLVATDHVCLLDNGNNLCGRIGTGWPIAKDPVDYEESLKWSPGWPNKTFAAMAQMYDMSLEKWYYYCNFGGIFMEGNNIIYVDKDCFRPFFLTMAKPLDDNQMFFRILTPWDKWYNFENRYVYALLTDSWLKSKKFLGLNTLGRFMLAHGMLEICRGLGGMVKAGYKATQVLFAYHARSNRPATDVAVIPEKPLTRNSFRRSRLPLRYRTQSVIFTSFPSRSATSPDFHLQSQSSQDSPPTPQKKKEKIKKRPPGNDSSSDKKSFKDTHEKEKHEKNEPNHPPLEVPEGLGTALDHRMRTLKVDGFSRAVDELRTMGVLVTVRGESYNFQCGGDSRTIHLRHGSGQGKREIFGDRLQQLRTFVQLTLLMARQEQSF
jgi:hypothetical protein